MSALWTIEAMAKAMNATRQGALPASISGISIDTRTAQPGMPSSPLSATAATATILFRPR